MNTGGLILTVGSLLSATTAFLWLVWRLGSGSAGKGKTLDSEITEAVKGDVEHIFDDEFREELRNRGRLHFEKIIGENAMFLQQDLRETTAQLNEYMRTELTRTLQEEFKNYQQSIDDAKQIAINSIEKTITTIEQQREFMERQLLAQTQANKEHMIKQLEQDMATILNHYIVKAIGNQIDLTDQLDYILDELEINKKAILEDITGGTA